MATNEKSKKGGEHSEDAKPESRPSQQRQTTRENQTGRGSGEGTSGLQRGDGHPNGR